MKRGRKKLAHRDGKPLVPISDCTHGSKVFTRSKGHAAYSSDIYVNTRAFASRMTIDMMLQSFYYPLLSSEQESCATPLFFIPNRRVLVIGGILVLLVLSSTRIVLCMLLLVEAFILQHISRNKK
jgi:hypothetical protein